MALRGVLTHRKTRRLAKLLAISPCFALGILEALWHTTAEQCPRGDIGSLSDQDIADELFYDGDAASLISALVEAGWLDPCEGCRLKVHDWAQHADSYVHASLAKRTLLFIDGTRPNIPHDAFNAGTRARIIAEYADKYGTTPEESRTSPGQVRAIPEPEPEPEPEIEGRPPKPPKFNPLLLEMPAVLDQPPIREKWAEWCKYRAKKRKPVSEESGPKQLEFLAKQPDPIAVIERSMRNDYTGLFPEGQSPTNGHKSLAERYEEL